MRAAGRGSSTGRGAATTRGTATGRTASGKASAARQARVAIDRALADDPEYWDRPEDDDYHLDPEDGPAPEDFAELPVDDDELADGDGLREDAPSRHRRMPAQLHLFVAASGAKDYLVRAPDPQRLEEPLLGSHLRERHDRLERVAAELAGLLPREALTAATTRELYLSLPLLAQVDLAEACGLSESEVSRDRNTVVGLACGSLPLQVLFWRSPLDDLVDRLESWPGFHQDWTRDSARDAAAYAGAAADTVRQLLPWMRATASTPQLAAAARAQLLLRPFRVDEVVARFTALLEATAGGGGPALDPKRGLVVRRRALLGVGEDARHG